MLISQGTAGDQQVFSIRGDEKKIGWVFSEILQLQVNSCLYQRRGRQSLPIRSASGDSHGGEGQKLAISGTMRETLSPSEDLQLQSSFIAIVADGELCLVKHLCCLGLSHKRIKGSDEC